MRNYTNEQLDLKACKDRVLATFKKKADKEDMDDAVDQLKKLWEENATELKDDLSRLNK